MNSDYKNRISEIIRKLKSDKKALFIICAAVFGMLLIMLSGVSSEKSADVTTDKITEDTADFEEKLQRLISRIEGAGRVSVMITYDSSGENIFAYDRNENFENEEQRIKSEYIIIDGENGETGLKLKTVYPKIKGVAVVCDGASDPVTKEQIVSVVSALFDINTKNISVVSYG